MTDTVYYSVSRERRALLEPSAPGEHVWILAALHRMSPDEIRTWHNGARVYLDAENLAATELGCYVCEEVWTAEIALQPCPGEPE